MKECWYILIYAKTTWGHALTFHACFMYIIFHSFDIFQFCMHRGIVKIIPLITSVNNHKNTGKAFGFQSLKRGVMGLVWLSAQIFVWLGHNRKHISTRLGGGALSRGSTHEESKWSCGVQAKWMVWHPQKVSLRPAKVATQIRHWCEASEIWTHALGYIRLNVTKGCTCCLHKLLRRGKWGTRGSVEGSHERRQSGNPGWGRQLPK